MAPAFTPTSHPTGSHYTAGDSQVTGTPSTGTSSSRVSSGTPSGRPAPYPVPDARGSQTQAQVEALRLARGASFEMETIPELLPPPSSAAEAFMPTQPFMPTPTPEGGPAPHVSALPEATMYATVMSPVASWAPNRNFRSFLIPQPTTLRLSYSLRQEG
ncbi:hypothetical protein AcV7_010417 [Taiwanofungus camphoratus]|nr:hypothetical protein AcV7_010417 [Antrodia cinnamomea]